jgi:hypothetical protein
LTFAFLVAIRCAAQLGGFDEALCGDPSAECIISDISEMDLAAEFSANRQQILDLSNK